MHSEFAYIYDEVMEIANYNEWYDFLKLMLKDINFNGTDIMDLGCGTGEILIRLYKDGYKVLGVDISSDMLSVAQDKMVEDGISIPLVNMDMRELRLPVEVDLVVSFFDTINYLTSENELETTLENIYKHLPKNGFFIFDIVTRKLIDDMFENNIFLDEREEITIIWRHFYNEEEGLDDFHTVYFVEFEKNYYKKIEEFHQKKIFEIGVVEKIAEKVGFKIAKKYENIELAGERIFFVLEKV
ncbi:class I SAM-dependent DNA methyltransferase [Haliovirga abyssi]|uniref:Methyltransferase YqeM n=1 Tax=Haliovirga abyssi TaxID=2996794 RepID=A0AAU9DF58_9FUSO|nr:class I SAM-dependent methyltransferase [Haliovirga abyssi]BDU50002.1 putative methyltransferase YqeM [Haliovirga abyssi]